MFNHDRDFQHRPQGGDLEDLRLTEGDNVGSEPVEGDSAGEVNGDG